MYYYYANNVTAGPYATPALAVTAAGAAGVTTFTVVRAAGPKGFYAAYRSYAAGRATPAPVAARTGRGRGYGYTGTPRRPR